jgi:hypothetical protein
MLAHVSDSGGRENFCFYSRERYRYFIRKIKRGRSQGLPEMSEWEIPKSNFRVGKISQALPRSFSWLKRMLPRNKLPLNDLQIDNVYKNRAQFVSRLFAVFYKRKLVPKSNIIGSWFFRFYLFLFFVVRLLLCISSK